MLVLMPEPALAQVQDVSPLRLALQTRQSAFHGGGAPKKIFCIAIRFHASGRPWCVRNRRRHAMSDQSVILINLLKVKPGKQDALIALLKQNTDAVIRTLPGWKTTRLIAAKDGASVVIYSEWENPAAVEAMRSDPRMTAYFPEIIELASLDSVMGSAVLSESR
ncbi:putative quinol monooxygenase [Phyllobacterium sp. 22229]|uniref:putative quinol monooxygenase n=1 Tax=Phyllobacterium sp. 22229 TaxID=3453895 RepID=UPI003F83E46A